VRIRVLPGGRVEGTASVPGDKSIAHRWLILVSTASGSSRLAGLPPSLDVVSTASCMAALAPRARPALEAWAENRSIAAEGKGSTWNSARASLAVPALEVEGDGWDGLSKPAADLDCGNAGTALRLLTGVVAARPFRATLVGDESLMMRPMERVAEPLRRMGADVATTDGHAPVTVDGGRLVGVAHETSVPTAQVKGAVLLAGLNADGETSFREPAATRDHTERALAWLGAPVLVEETTVRVGPFQHRGFEGVVPGDPSSAAFLIAAAALTGSGLTIDDVGINPSRLHFLDVLERMGVRTSFEFERDEVGEPVGRIRVGEGADLTAVTVDVSELPLVIDEIPVLAFVAAHARGESRFLGAGELRVKESNRLGAVVEGIRRLGGGAADEQDDLVVSGGGLTGGAADAAGDHRMAMALAVGGLAATGPVVVEGIEVADVSFPGFVPVLAALGARVETTG
jgi:3-phosphoshikimate 1-carboxyvinyltransferase